MALTVEDGTGLAVADSYISLAAADAYFVLRNSPAAWTALADAAKESALRYATEYLDGFYKWVGSVKTLTPAQQLGWPRQNAYDCESRLIEINAVPVPIEHAACEVALAHADTALNTIQARGGAVTREKVGSIEVSYSDIAQAEPTMPHVRRLLRGYGTPRASSIIDVERA